MFVTQQFEANKRYIFMISQFGLTALSGTFNQEFNGMVEFDDVKIVDTNQPLLPTVDEAKLRIRKDDIISYAWVSST